jgi:hypothetical protein
MHAAEMPPEEAAASAAATAAAAAAFLTAIGHMKDLVRLEITEDHFSASGFGVTAAQPARFEALTVSSKLQRLVLQSMDELPLPCGAVQHMFPRGRLLPHLTHLSFEAKSSMDEWAMWNSDDTAGFMTAAELTSMFAACPALVALYLPNALQTGDLTPLLQLPKSVTLLSVGGAAFVDSAAAVVAQLTQLRNLNWEVSPDLTDAGLQQLTALRGLTRLELFSVPGLSQEVIDVGCTEHGYAHKVNLSQSHARVGEGVESDGVSKCVLAGVCVIQHMLSSCSVNTVSHPCWAVGFICMQQGSRRTGSDMHLRTTGTSGSQMLRPGWPARTYLSRLLLCRAMPCTYGQEFATLMCTALLALLLPRRTLPSGCC